MSSTSSSKARLNNKYEENLSINTLARSRPYRRKFTTQNLELEISFLQENTTNVDREYVERALQQHHVQLCYVQEVVEYDWQRRIKDFEKYIYSDDAEGVDAAIEKMISEHKVFSQQKFSTFGVTWKPFINSETTRSELKQVNIQLSQKTSLDRKNQCISEFNKQIGMLMASNRTVPEKYGKLKMELEICLRQYYDKLPWPLNDQTIGAVDDELQQIFYRVMQNLFTPEVKEQLKRDRMAQMEMMSKLNLGNNESFLWVYCVGCRRIFAGRTRGCVNVTCSQFNNKVGVRIVDHGCGITFEWAKAQPVPINTLSSDIWFSSIETDQRADFVKNLISDVTDDARNISSAGANGSGWSFPMNLYTSNSNMTDKKTSATKKASTATKKATPAAPKATPAAPKAEKAEVAKTPVATTPAPAPAQPKAKAATPSAKSTSSLAKTSTKVTKKSTSTKGGAKKKEKFIKYYIDCTHPVEDGIFDLNAFERFLLEKMKINGKTSNLGETVGIEKAKSKISVTSKVPLSKRYMKYLTKKFLKKHELRDWLRVIANSKDAYELRYFNINQEENEAEEA
ncbi:unnamed protein product [Rotaria socialis]|uniref:Large ribosomal subunit protein eL22 n=1 Tax=Rotaria socialis TaxID=392032 RepID=A0A821BBX9_9BILA|nr:unnamed protein product [Rotaria socialis]